MAKQISIFAENQPGKIKNVTQVLSNNNIQIKSITLDRGTTDYGAIKLLVDNPKKAEKILKQNKIPIKLTEVIVIQMNKTSNSIFSITQLLSNNNINIKDAYGFVTEKENKSLLVVEVENNSKVKKILKNKNINILTDKQIYSF